MESSLKSIIFWSFIPLLVLAQGTAIAEEDLQLEKLLPPEVAIIASCNQLGSHFEDFCDSQLCEIIAAFHHIDKPEAPPLKDELSKVFDHPFYHLVKTKVVLGFIPPKQPNTPPIFMALGSGDASLAEHIQKLFTEEENQQKLYRVGTEEYRGVKIEAILQVDKGRMEKRFAAVTGGLFAVSNSLDHLKGCLDRLHGEGQAVPSRYLALPPTALVKIYVDVQKLGIDLSQRGPMEKRYPALKEFADKIRSAIAETQSISAYVTCDQGLFARIARERKAGTEALLPVMSLPQDLVDKRTVAFFAAPVPYALLWHAAKAKAMHKDPKGWRKLEAALNNLFEWESFEEDILPQIGPETAILINIPATTEGPPVFPHASLLVKIAPELDLMKPVKGLWEWALKNQEFARHFQPAPQDVEGGGVIVRGNLKNTPLDKLVDPAHAVIPGCFILGSHGAELPKLISVLRTSKTPYQTSLYGFISFPALVHLLQVNHSFIQKQAENKGKPFAAKKLELFHSLLNLFQRVTVEWTREGEDTEMLDISLKMK